jgi:phosphoribosylformylglycinamidine cyclo-ligase
MPGMYAESAYDLAGTIVVVVDRKRIIDGKRIRKGDGVIGIPSTGLHTNGYSLARKVLLERFAPDSYVEELGGTLGDVLLAVHRSYLRVITALRAKFEVRGLAHITGGGIEGNTMRVIPRGKRLRVDWEAWERPALYRLIQRLGDVPENDMRKTFNLGIGLVVIVPGAQCDNVMDFLKKRGEGGVLAGEVVI